MNDTLSKFNTSRQYIASRLFIPERPRQGAWATLNITVLPDYLVYIKKQLTKQEVLVLSDYHLQTYLLEASTKKEPDSDFDKCTEKIIAHIRNNKQFWVKKTGETEENQKKHFAISEYKKDMDEMAKLTLGASDKYPEVPFSLNSDKKITDDYIYLKNVAPRSSCKYSAYLFSSIINFSMDRDQPEEEIMKIPLNFLQQILTHFASKVKFRSRSNYNITEEEERLNKMGDELIAKFTEWLENKEVQYDILDSSKECNFSFNMISILTLIIARYSYPQSYQDYELQSEQNLEEIKSDAYNRAYSERQIEQLVVSILKNEKNLLEIRRARENQELKSKQKLHGFLHTPEQFYALKNSYEEMMRHPANLSRTRYKIVDSQVPWSEEDYSKFLQKFYDFFNIPTNNKKIAAMMGKSIEPNHVKHVKGLYMRNMSIRMENGEIGGGKKGTFESKLDFLKKDMENFSMKYFKKEAKVRNKKAKKKRKKLSLNDDDDSDY